MIKRGSLLVLALVIAGGTPVAAQDEDRRCIVLCAPDVKIEPTLTFEPIFRRPTLADATAAADLATWRPETEAVFEIILAIGVDTAIPRVGLTLETIFIPTESTDANPFTGVTAEQAGRTSFRGNEIEVELELNLNLIEAEQTGGWLGSHFDIVDKISAAERPVDTSSYTHKLNFEWDTAVHVFNWLPEGNWLRNVEIEGSLDYVVTGLPRAGDVIGGERFLTADSPWSFSLVFVFPLAPLVP